MIAYFGTALMEAAVAQFLVDSHQRSLGAHSLTAGWEKGLTKSAVKLALVEYETNLTFELTVEQRNAVIGAVMTPVCGISGGAGTGKTTILQAILGVYGLIAGELPCYQVALAGRAAQRMAESTGRPAQTIAKLIAEHLGDKKPDLPEHLLLVIDEASMVDLLSMYRLVGILPLATRLIFVGDTSQLPPVGNGLVFHSLTNGVIPFFHLSQVKRQDSQSLIHRFATSIRNSQLELPARTKSSLSLSNDCSFEPNISLDRLIDLWQEAGGISNSIVLSPIKKGMLGVNNINTALQSTIGVERSALYFQDSLRGWIPWITSTGTKILLGDPVLVTVNNYDDEADLRNGDLGIVTEVFKEPGEDGAIGVIEVNKVSIRVTIGVLEKLQLGYAITIHKSQGSQWQTCFVMLPQEAEAMIDQTLLYTASTRPSEKLVLMGYQTVIEQAIRRGSIALSRKTFLRERIESAVNITNEY
jgi:exodeoxyribonuclease V alpha subunit